MATIVFVDGIRDAAGELAVQPAAKYLRDSGHTVAVFTNGDDAVKFLDETAPDIVVSGLVLLDRTAMELAKIAKRRYPTHPPACVAFTITTPEGDVFRDWAEAIDVYLLGRDKWPAVLAIEALLKWRTGHTCK